MFGGALEDRFDTTMRREEPTEDFIVLLPSSMAQRVHKGGKKRY